MGSFSDADLWGASSAPGAPVYNDTQQPVTPGQAGAYAASPSDQNQPQGSPHNPFFLHPGTQVPPGAWYADQGGGVHQAGPQGLAAPVQQAAPAPSPSQAAPQPSPAPQGAPQGAGLTDDQLWGHGDPGAAAGPPPAQKADQLEGFVHGVDAIPKNLETWGTDALDAMHVPQSARALLARAGWSALNLGPDFGDQLKANEDWERQRTQQGYRPGEWGKFAGEALEAAPLNAFGPLMGGAAYGGLTTDNPNNAGHVLADVLLGGVGGRIGDKVTRVAADAVAPQVTSAARWLMDRGVKLTPGQAMGGTANSLEQKATSLPIVGEMISQARGRAADSMRRGFAEDVLSPLTDQGWADHIPADVDGVHGMVGHVQDATNAAYTRILPNASITLDPELAADLAKIKPDVDIMPTDIQEQLGRIVQNRVAQRLTPGAATSPGAITVAGHSFGPIGSTLEGDALQAVHSDLGNLGTKYSASSDSGQRDMGEALLKLRDSVRDAVTRQNPDMGAQLTAANKAYAGQIRLQRAAASRPTGDFSTAQLAQAIRAGDRSKGKSAYAAGDAFLQDWAKNGVGVLGPTVADSGTAGRGMLAALLLEGTHALHNPVALASSLAAIVPYTKWGQNAAQGWMNSGPGRDALAQVLRSLRPAGALAGAAGGVSLLPDAAGATP